MVDVNERVDLGPGSVIVVGPNGRFSFDASTGRLNITGCQFLGTAPTYVEDEQRRLVEAVNAIYFHDGAVVRGRTN